MADRFRELERPQTGRLKDVVLMATVTSFEGLRHPRRSDLRQFAELFEPLFLASSDEARRQAAAALSQCPHLPAPTALLIGRSPIAIAAIFLTRSAALDDATLIDIIVTASDAHASAIARRDDLSAQVVDALVARRQMSAPALREKPGREKARISPGPASAPADSAQDARFAREEALRDEIRATAMTGPDPEGDPPLAAASPLHSALLVRFARMRERHMFSFALGDALNASDDLPARILLDTSGRQLAATLAALRLDAVDIETVLASLYPHLLDATGDASAIRTIARAAISPESLRRLEAWLRADRYSGMDPDPLPPKAANAPMRRAEANVGDSEESGWQMRFFAAKR